MDNEQRYIALRKLAEAELELEINQATQFATVYRNNRPVASVARRRVLDRAGPDFQVYATDGLRMFQLWAAGADPARSIKRRIAARIVHQEHGL